MILSHSKVFIYFGCSASDWIAVAPDIAWTTGSYAGELEKGPSLPNPEIDT